MPIATENVFDLITGEYYELTAAEKKTADYIMSHRQESQFLSIAELAEESGVAEATISRFCRRLGYKGYNAFKLAIANASAVQHQGPGTLSGRIEEDDSFEVMCGKLLYADREAMTQTQKRLHPEEVRRAVDLLKQARKVICMGQGGSMLLASEAAHLFSTVDGKFFAVSDSHSQAIAAANMGKEDVILFFSYSGATRDMMETLTIAGEYGASVILVTRFPKSPGAALAKVVLACGSDESPLQLGSVPAKIAQMFLLDVLFTEYCRRDLDACLESRERIAAALADKHL
ncbi:MAG: MurR/RpiR family transcriptional regulator [Oscillospiraceae bacterium]|nr:MurR/RpiR family transcriptional regulator [Oscillospiraceae bacterium]